jgi:hypothetical protein
MYTTTWKLKLLQELIWMLNVYGEKMAIFVVYEKSSCRSCCSENMYTIRRGSCEVFEK